MNRASFSDTVEKLRIAEGIYPGSDGYVPHGNSDANVNGDGVLVFGT
jgi:hypothetical protein